MTCETYLVGLVGLWLLVQIRRWFLLTDEPHGHYWPKHCWLRARPHDMRTFYGSPCRRCGHERAEPRPY